MRPSGSLILAVLPSGCGGDRATHAIIVGLQPDLFEGLRLCAALPRDPGLLRTGCSNAAINRSRYAAYLSDVSVREPACYGEDPCAALDDAICQASAACQGAFANSSLLPATCLQRTRTLETSAWPRQRAES